MNDRLIMLGRIAAGVAHDLANYLAIVDLSLTRAARAAPECHGDVAAAREAADRAASLTKCLVAYARGGTPELTWLDLGTLVRRLLGLFPRMIPDHVRVEVDVDPDRALVLGVGPELEQLVINLVLNACHAMPDGGDLFVGVHVVNRAVRLEVTDTGNGLRDASGASADLLSPSSKPGRSGGGGLGLGIIRAVTDRHGATLLVTPRPGGGTVVLVTFPVAAPLSLARA